MNLYHFHAQTYSFQNCLRLKSVKGEKEWKKIKCQRKEIMKDI